MILEYAGTLTYSNAFYCSLVSIRLDCYREEWAQCCLHESLDVTCDPVAASFLVRISWFQNWPLANRLS